MGPEGVQNQWKIDDSRFRRFGVSEVNVTGVHDRLQIQVGGNAPLALYGPDFVRGVAIKKRMLLVYGFLTQDFIPHEKPWTRIAKSLFFNVFVTLACVSRHPPRLWSVLNELLVYGFLTRSAHVCYRTHEIMMVFFSSNTSWTKVALQNRKGNYNGFSYTNSM